MRVAILTCLLVPITALVAHAQSEADSSVAVQRKQESAISAAPLISWYNGMPLRGPAVHGADRIDASGFGYAIGTSATFWLGTTWGLHNAIMYMKQNVSAGRDMTISTQIDIDPEATSTPPLTMAPVRLESSASFDLLRVSVGYLQEFAVVGDMRIGIYAGPGFAYVVGANQYETVTLDPSVQGGFHDPERFPADNNGRTIILYDSIPKNQLGTRMSVLGGLRFELPISASFSLVSSVEYDYVLLPEKQFGDQRVNSLMITMGIGRTGFE